MADIIQINDNTWRIEDNKVRFFLLAGTEKALLIDSGMNTPNAKQIAESITKLPIMLLNTHADPDHISGNGSFDYFYMHPDEEDVYRSHGGLGTILPVKDNDIIDLGNRPLKIFFIPGHTPGSIAVLDINNRVLISGDSIQDGNIFMFKKHRNMPLYVESLKKLSMYTDEFDTIYPSHGSFPVYPGLIASLIEGAEQIIGGTAKGKVVDMFGTPVVNGHLKNSIFGHKKTSNFGHEKPAVIQNLSLAITVEELPRRQWSVAERLLGNSHSLSPVKLTCSYCYLSSWLY